MTHRAVANLQLEATESVVSPLLWSARAGNNQPEPKHNNQPVRRKCATAHERRRGSHRRHGVTATARLQSKARRAPAPASHRFADTDTRLCLTAPATTTLRGSQACARNLRVAPESHHVRNLGAQVTCRKGRLSWISQECADRQRQSSFTRVGRFRRPDFAMGHHEAIRSTVCDVVPPAPMCAE